MTGTTKQRKNQMESPDPTKTCGECAHYRPCRNPASNRVLPSLGGNCGWRPENKWPIAFLTRDRPPMILPAHIVFGTMNATLCECFEKKGKP